MSLILAALMPAFAADLKPLEHEPSVAAVVATMLENYHYDERPLNDELSERWLDLYIERLDPARMVFLESDIEEFERYRHKLDEGLASDPVDLKPAFAIFNRFLQRWEEASGTALTALEAPIDVNTDATWVPNRKDAGLGWPATAAERDAIWQNRVTDDMITGLLQEQDVEERTKLLKKRYERLAQSWEQMESVDALEIWLTALASAYDPHSSWFKPATRDNFDIDISNSVEGIGASLQVKDDYTTVMAIIPGGPAEQDGTLQVGDRIVAVAQGDADYEDTVGLRIDKVVKLIRGKKGTTVQLEVIPAGEPMSARAIIPITRDRVLLSESDAESRTVELEGKTWGIIDVPSFYTGPDDNPSAGVTSDVKRLLGELDDAEGVIIDLRQNGGGSLQEAVELSGLFVKSGPMVQARDRQGRVQALNDPDRRVVWSKPVVVLTSPLSASASEIVAGALQDYGRALIVGAEQTHGKGTVQQVAPLGRMLSRMGVRNGEDVGGALKVTIQKFYRVSGSSTQNRGVQPDIVLPSPYDGLDIYERDLDYALPWDTIPPVPHPASDSIASLVDELAASSAGRVASDEGFAELRSLLEERAKVRERTEISLNLEARKAELDDLERRTGIEQAENEAEGVEGEDEEEEKDDAVLDEALRILVEFAARV